LTAVQHVHHVHAGLARLIGTLVRHRIHSTDSNPLLGSSRSDDADVEVSLAGALRVYLEHGVVAHANSLRLDAATRRVALTRVHR